MRYVIVVIFMFVSVFLKADLAQACAEGEQTCICSNCTILVEDLVENEENLDITVDEQRMITTNFGVRPERLVTKVLLDQNRKKEVFYKPLNGVLFRSVPDEYATRLINLYREHKDKLGELRVYYHSNYGNKDFILTKHLKLSEVCALDIPEYNKVEGVLCLWADAVNLLNQEHK